jgi:hypothetical protein
MQIFLRNRLIYISFSFIQLENMLKGCVDCPLKLRESAQPIFEQNYHFSRNNSGGMDKRMASLLPAVLPKENGEKIDFRV